MNRILSNSVSRNCTIGVSSHVLRALSLSFVLIALLGLFGGASSASAQDAAASGMQLVQTPPSDASSAAPAADPAPLLSPAEETTATQQASAPSQEPSADSAAPVADPVTDPAADAAAQQNEQLPSLSDVLGADSVIKPEDANGAGMIDSETGLPVNANGSGNPAMPPVVKKDDEATQERKQAYERAINGMMPLKPSEIRQMLESYDETTQAVETPVYPTPDPESSFVQASLDPGQKPVVVKTAAGLVTTLSIVDVTGQPWPIQDLTWAGDFQVEQPEGGSHIVRISPNSHFAHGNISMRLIGLNPPVIFTLVTERKTAHVRLDVQIPEVGPKGVLPPVITPVSIKAGDDEITKVLLGTASSAGMERLTVDGVDGRTSAYQKAKVTYLRTPYTLLSPAWIKSVQSADGMHVYAMESTPVVLLSDKGKMVRAYITMPMEQADGQ